VRAVTSEEARRLDEATIAAGTPGILLMERAAAAVAAEVEKVLERRSDLGGEIVVVAGAGNNGGDGLEVARLLSRGRPGRVTVLLVGDPDRLPPDAATMRKRLEGSGASFRLVREEGDLEPLRGATLAVDALFGTGLTRPIGEGTLEEHAVRLLSLVPFGVAVDIPSGLFGGRKEIPGPHVEADLTVTFGRPKLAHVLTPAAGACGRLTVARIGLLAEQSPDEGSGPETVTGSDVARLFPRRPAESHKGTYGTLGVVGGADGMAGAPALAAQAAFRAGAGKVVVSAPEAVRHVVHLLCPEATTAAEEVDPSSWQAAAVGPGLGQTPESRTRLDRARKAPVPAVFDADALNLAGADPAFFRREFPTVLTPHPGEAARLLGTSTARIGLDRTGAASELARGSGAVVILKGFRSVVADPGGRIAFVLSGNPGMATGGAGDVLTGIVGAFLARGLDGWTAAAAGAYLHGLAGDLASERLGEEALTASDIVRALADAWLSLGNRRSHGPGR